MVSTNTDASTEILVSLPRELLEQIDEIAAALRWTRGEVFDDAVRRYLKSELRWRRIQAIGAERARAVGLFTEDDIEEFLDSLPDNST